MGDIADKSPRNDIVERSSYGDTFKGSSYGDNDKVEWRTYVRRPVFACYNVEICENAPNSCCDPLASIDMFPKPKPETSINNVEEAETEKHPEDTSVVQPLKKSLEVVDTSVSPDKEAPVEQQASIIEGPEISEQDEVPIDQQIKALANDESTKVLTNDELLDMIYRRSLDDVAFKELVMQRLKSSCINAEHQIPSIPTPSLKVVPVWPALALCDPTKLSICCPMEIHSQTGMHKTEDICIPPGMPSLTDAVDYSIIIEDNSLSSLEPTWGSIDNDPQAPINILEPSTSVNIPDKEMHDSKILTDDEVPIVEPAKTIVIPSGLSNLLRRR